MALSGNASCPLGAIFLCTYQNTAAPTDPHYFFFYLSEKREQPVIFMMDIYYTHCFSNPRLAFQGLSDNEELF